MKKIISKCCGAKLRWRKRGKRPTKIVNHPQFGKIAIKLLGPRVRAYVCDDCGKPDRPVA